MKTKLDLNALIPVIIDLLENQDMRIGDYRDGEYLSNSLCYEEDGWLIEIDYRCTGYWNIEDSSYDYPGCCEVSGWGEIDSIVASHYDNDTDEETEFSEEDLTDLSKAVIEYLKVLE